MVEALQYNIISLSFSSESESISELLESAETCEIKLLLSFFKSMFFTVSLFLFFNVSEFFLNLEIDLHHHQRKIFFFQFCCLSELQYDYYNI